MFRKYTLTYLEVKGNHISDILLSGLERKKMRKVSKRQKEEEKKVRVGDKTNKQNVDIGESVEKPSRNSLSSFRNISVPEIMSK